MDLAKFDELVRGGASLVTLWGPAGVGKTRLVLEWAGSLAAATLGADSADVWFCELGDARTIEGVCAALARVIGITLTDVTSGSAVRTLGHALAGRGRVVLILDNCEQCVEPIAAACAAWLDVADGLSIVATSREPLHVDSEQRYELLPLTAPRSTDDALEFASVRLFLDRAGRVTPGTAWEQHAGIVGAIVRRLDGLPLAIELAAARLDVMSPALLLERLRERLSLLGRRSTGPTARHATLRATLDWSWALLLPHEQAALAQCATFCGGFDLPAFEAVIDLAERAEAPPHVDVLQALRQKSLIRSYEASEARGESRFALYEVVREYADEQLTRGPTRAEAFARHAEHYLRRCGPVRARATEAEWAVARDRVAMELDNVVAASERASGDFAGLRAAIVLEDHFVRRGPLPAYLAMLDRALNDPAAQDAPAAMLARTLIARGRARMLAGLLDGAATDFATALGSAERAGDELLQGRVLAALGVLDRMRGDLDSAMRHLSRSMTLLRAGDDPDALGVALSAAANVFLWRGDLDEARRLWLESRSSFRASGNRLKEGIALGNLGVTSADGGRSEEAKGYLEDAVARLRGANHMSCATFLGNLGLVYRDLGDLARGKALVAEALELFRACGARLMYGPALAWMGFLHHEEGNLEEACRSYEEARDVHGEVGDWLNELQFLGPHAAVQAQLGRVREAERMLDGARARVESTGNRTLLRSFEIHAGQLDVARARQHEDLGESAAAARALAQARQRLGGADVESSDEVRLARRLLERALATFAATHPAERRRESRGVLHLGEEARWFAVGASDRVDLQRRQSLRLILLALARCRAAGAPVALSLDEVIAAGWPGEKMLSEAAASRAYVALNRLRALGLREVISRRDDGYLLDPAFEVVLEG